MGSQRATAKAKGDMVAALKAFRASCRNRQAKFLATVRALAKEHERDVDALSEAEDRFSRTVDPEGRVLNREAWSLVNWGPGEVEVPGRDSVDEFVPGGNIDAALDDVEAILNITEDAYAD